MTKEEIYKLLHSTETSRVERTISTGDMDKFQEAICAFSNDMSNSRQNGYLIIGAKDNGELSGLKVDDNLFKKISGIRSDGNILPIPMMTCERYELEGGDILVVEVQPSFSTPVRYRGRTFIRIGPRRDIATIDEERSYIPCDLHIALKYPQITQYQSSFTTFGSDMSRLSRYSEGVHPISLLNERDTFLISVSPNSNAASETVFPSLRSSAIFSILILII